MAPFGVNGREVNTSFFSVQITSYLFSDFCCSYGERPQHAGITAQQLNSLRPLHLSAQCAGTRAVVMVGGKRQAVLLWRHALIAREALQTQGMYLHRKAGIFRFLSSQWKVYLLVFANAITFHLEAHSFIYKVELLIESLAAVGSILYLSLRPLKWFIGKHKHISSHLSLRYPHPFSNICVLLYETRHFSVLVLSPRVQL